MSDIQISIKDIDYVRLYFRDFKTDEKFMAMNLAECGLYLLLLLHQCDEGSVPEDFAILSKILGRDATPEYLSKLWSSVASCFRKSARGRVQNPRMSREIVRSMGDVARYKNNGKKGGEVSARVRQTNGVQPYGSRASKPSFKRGLSKASSVGSDARAHARFLSSPFLSYINQEGTGEEKTAFQIFCEIWPGQLDEVKTREVWDLIDPSDELCETIIRFVYDRKTNDPQWQEESGRFAGAAHNFLSDSGWKVRWTKPTNGRVKPKPRNATPTYIIPEETDDDDEN